MSCVRCACCLFLNRSRRLTLRRLPHQRQLVSAVCLGPQLVNNMAVLLFLPPLSPLLPSARADDVTHKCMVLFYQPRSSDVCFHNSASCVNPKNRIQTIWYMVLRRERLHSTLLEKTHINTKARRPRIIMALGRLLKLSIFVHLGTPNASHVHATAVKEVEKAKVGQHPVFSGSHTQTPL